MKLLVGFSSTLLFSKEDTEWCLLSFLINDEGKSSNKKINCNCFQFSYFCPFLLHHSLSLLCSVAHLHAQLFSSCTCTGSHIPHTDFFLSVFTPFTPWSLISLLCCPSFLCFISLSLSHTHVQFSLFHYWIPGDISTVLPSRSKGCYSSRSLIVFMFIVQHQ